MTMIGKYTGYRNVYADAVKYMPSELVGANPTPTPWAIQLDPPADKSTIKTI
jgi:hypothetical protein